MAASFIGMRDFAKEFYSSQAWKDCRRSYRKSVGGLCERCLTRGIYTPGEIVHHKIHLTPANINNPDIALARENLELLCRDCHAEAHRNERRYTVTADGQVSPRGT